MNGSHDTSYTLHFEGGGSQDGNFVSPDNFFQPGYAYRGFDRVSYWDGFFQIEQTEPRMYQIDVAVDPANQSKRLTGVTFANQLVSTDVNRNVAVWALSGASNPVPEPATLATLGLGAFALVRRRKSK